MLPVSSIWHSHATNEEIDLFMNDRELMLPTGQAALKESQP
jgi:hypothetical protein